MKLDQIQKYVIKIRDDYSYQLTQNGEVCKFSKPATTRGIAKIYTVTGNNELCYVGIARQPMAA